jgi:hypothetical protein
MQIAGARRRRAGEWDGHGRKERPFKGNLPEIDPAVFNALPAAERKDLVKRGIVKLEPTWSRADNGKVSVEPLPVALA